MFKGPLFHSVTDNKQQLISLQEMVKYSSLLLLQYNYNYCLDKKKKVLYPDYRNTQ